MITIPLNQERANATFSLEDIPFRCIITKIKIMYAKGPLSAYPDSHPFRRDLVNVLALFVRLKRKSHIRSIPLGGCISGLLVQIEDVSHELSFRDANQVGGSGTN